MKYQVTFRCVREVDVEKGDELDQYISDCFSVALSPHDEDYDEWVLFQSLSVEKVDDYD